MQPNRPNFYRPDELNDMYEEKKKRKINLWGALILLVVIVVGLVIWFIYGVKSNELPLPSSAKMISTNSMQVPFPYIESKNGETWKLIGGNQSGTLQIANKGKVVVDIPLTNTRTPLYNTKSGKRYLEGYKYRLFAG